MRQARRDRVIDRRRSRSHCYGAPFSFPFPRLGSPGPGGYVKVMRLSGTRLSWLREVMSSFRNTRVRKRGPKRPN